MPTYSKTSLDRLSTCHPDLIRLFQRVVQTIDCTILEGHRGQEEQNKAFREGKSQKPWPLGNHNAIPSRALDAAPFPVKFPSTSMSKGEYAKCLGQFYFFAGQVMEIARKEGIKIRWGGDWNSNGDVRDNSFDDLVHFELV